MTGLDFDNGTEFLAHAVIEWAGKREIFLTRSRPYKKNDQATIEPRNAPYSTGSVWCALSYLSAATRLWSRLAPLGIDNTFGLALRSTATFLLV